METELAEAVASQTERNKDTKRRILCTYKEMLHHYKEEGLGERSKYAGCIIKQNMIDTLERRFIQLGGELEDVWIRQDDTKVWYVQRVSDE